jgi:ATP-binding cassette, subfamily B, bacterial
LILDEPTAHLDVRAEAARSGASRGMVTLIVSHRFSTVRMADLIVVLDVGTIREQGSHEELMRRKGLYADLYALQARAYQ